MKYYVYIVECADGTFYTGYTTDLQRRLNEHNSGKGAKYTRCRRPVKIVWSFPFDTKSEAMRNEYAFKQMTRRQKVGFLKCNGSKNWDVKWPTLEGRLNHPLTSRGEALRQMKNNGDILTPRTEKELVKYEKSRRK